jgi:hypothetical protein
MHEIEFICMELRVGRGVSKGHQRTGSLSLSACASSRTFCANTFFDHEIVAIQLTAKRGSQRNSQKDVS